MSSGACSGRTSSSGAPTPPGHVVGVRVDPRPCSWIVEIADFDGAPTLTGEDTDDGRRSGLSKCAVFDETASGGSPGFGSRRASNPEESWGDRERQRRDQALVSGRKRRDVQGASLEETEATGSSGSSDAGLLEEELEGHLMIHAEAGGSSSNEAPLDHVLRRGFGRAGSWKLASPAKAGGKGDSRIERSTGCSSRRSVAEVGRMHLPRRGEAGREAESAGAG